jgi:hypothetical protein
LNTSNICWWWPKNNNSKDIRCNWFHCGTWDNPRDRPCRV